RNEKTDFDENLLVDEDFLIVEALENQPVLRVQDISAIVDKKNVLPILNRLLEKNIIVLKEEIQEQYRPRMVRYVRLEKYYSSEENLAALMDSLSRAPKQRQVVLSLFQLQGGNSRPVKVADLEKVSTSSGATLKALVKKGVLEEYFIQTDRVVYEGGKGDAESVELNGFQENALRDIRHSFK